MIPLFVGVIEFPIDLHPKEKPHFMSREPKDIFARVLIAASVLGKIYDLTSSYDGVQVDGAVVPKI